MSQIPERREIVRKAIEKVTEDVEDSVQPKNRDKVSANIAAFKRELNQWSFPSESRRSESRAKSLPSIREDIQS
jgi:hypothetical protein